MFEEKVRFELKPEHLKLLSNMYVNWQDCEFGAPEINPKLPYGNSDVIVDLHIILQGDLATKVEITDELEDEYKAIHRETETALQIVLSTQSFEPGIYESDWPKRNWRKVSD